MGTLQALRKNFRLPEKPESKQVIPNVGKSVKQKMLESTNNSLNSVEFLVQQHKMRKRTPKKSKKMRPLETVKNEKLEKEEYETPEKDEK